MSMRRLVDESPDALERSLLEAGQELDVPQGPKARLLAGLAAGTALTAVAVKTSGTGKLWTAWLGTKAAKFTGGIALVAGGIGAAAVFTQQTAPDPGSHGDTTGGALAAVSDAHRTAPEPASPSSPAPAGERLQGSDDPSDDDAAQSALVPTDAEPAPKAKSPAPSGTRSSRSARAASAPDRLLREEAMLVARIRSAVSDRDFALADRLSRQYWSRFENGQLNPEVRALDSRRASRDSGK